MFFQPQKLRGTAASDFGKNREGKIFEMQLGTNGKDQPVPVKIDGDDGVISIPHLRLSFVVSRVGDLEM